MNQKKLFAEYILDLVSRCGQMSIKSMFGGYGLYKNRKIVGIIADSELYFKVKKDFNQKQFEDMGSEPFTYNNSKGNKISICYWQVPLEILEDEEKLCIWLDKSYQIE